MNRRLIILSAALGLCTAAAVGYYLLPPQDTATKVPPKPILRPLSMPKLALPKFNNTAAARPVVDDPVFSLISERKNAAAIERFEKNSIDLNALQPKSGFTPYVVAARSCNEDMVRYLDRRGADMTIELSSGNPVLVSAYLNAATEGCLPVVRYLVEEKKIDINATSKTWKETALYKAADGHHAELARYLLKKGIDPSVKSVNGRTALEVAREKGYADIVELIRNLSL